ncbi:MAG: XRE family transcriptional regulator [Desulfurellales bacterium]|nr:MAG: XRE family transcriptional regulator [Desulfurellales bacterium]
MTPFTEHTAASAGRRGGMKRSRAQLRALRLGRATRLGSGYVPDDKSEVAGILATARGIVATARKGGSPPDPRGLRGLARHLGVSPGTVSRWFAGASWPRPDAVARIRAWIETAGALDGL